MAGNVFWRAQKRSIKFLAVVLTVLMVSMLFGACTKNDGQNTTGTAIKASATTAVKPTAVNTSKTAAAATSTAKVTTSQATASETQGSANQDGGMDDVVTEETEVDAQTPGGVVTEEAPFDLGGRQVKWISWQVIDLNGNEATADAYAKTVYGNVKKAEVKYNFQMVFDKSYVMGAPLYHTRIWSELLAGINPADIYSLNNSYVEAYGFVKNRLVVCLNDYIDFDNDPYMKNHTWGAVCDIKGKYYGLCPHVYTGNNGILYNKVVLAREGLSDIWDLFELNRWDWQTMLDYAIRATKDTNGDGIIDQWGCTVYNNSTFVTYLLNSNGLPAVGQVNGKFISNYDTSAGKRALQFAVDLAFVHKVVGSGGGAEYRKGTVLFMWAPFWYNSTPVREKMESLVGPLPGGPDRKETVSIKPPGTNQYVSALSSIPREASIILRDAMICWTEDGQNVNADYIAARGTGLREWEEGYSPRWYITERDAVNSSQCVYPVIAEFDAMTGANTVAGGIVTDIMKGVSVSTAVDTYIGQINAKLADFN